MIKRIMALLDNLFPHAWDKYEWELSKVYADERTPAEQIEWDKAYAAWEKRK